LQTAAGIPLAELRQRQGANNIIPGIDPSNIPEPDPASRIHCRGDIQTQLLSRCYTWYKCFYKTRIAKKKYIAIPRGPANEGRIFVLDLGKKIKEIRLKKELSRHDLAEALNIGENTLRRWESGKRTPDNEEKVRIAEALGVSVAYLLGRKNG